MDSSKVINTILENSTMAETAPRATLQNTSDVGAYLLQDNNRMNEFLSILMNKIGLTYVHNKMFKNKLAILKTGKMPFGDTVESLYVNPATSTGYDPNKASSLLAQVKPTTFVDYAKRNRADQYTVTITKTTLKEAFMSNESFGSFVSAIQNSLTSGNQIDEFKLFKAVMGNAVKDGKTFDIAVDDIATSKEKASAFIQTIIDTTDILEYPSTTYNAFKKINTGDEFKACTTWTEKSDQVVIMKSSAKNKVNLDVLAYAFNLSKVSLPDNMILVDNFGVDENGVELAPNTYCMIVDKGWFKLFDNMMEFTEFFNAQTISWNYYLTVMQTLGSCLFANAVSISKKTV